MSKEELSVVELLKRKREQENSEQRFHLPAFLTIHNDIRPVERTKYSRDLDHRYKISEFAKDYIKEHSNLTVILDEYYKTVTEKIFQKDNFTGFVIRSVMSSSMRRLQTVFKDFSFTSDEHECISRTLLTNPSIKTAEDFENFLKLQDKFQLKFCSIPLSSDVVHRDSLDFINKQRREQNIEGRPSFYNSRFYWFLQRRDYERRGVVRELFLSHIDVRFLEKISNFRRHCERLMEEDKIDASKYETFARCLLAQYKSDPGFMLSHKYLLIDPLYEIITNIMTEDQQNLVAESREYFYSLTNAKKIHARLDDGSSRFDFYREYQQRGNDQRKLPPYHNLFFVRPDESTVEDSRGENSEIPIAPEPTSIPARYLVQIEPEEDKLEFLEFAARKREFVANVKKHLREKYEKDFAKLWSQYREDILMNFVNDFWGGSFAELERFFDGCSEEVIEEARRFFGKSASTSAGNDLGKTSSDVVMMSPGIFITPQIQQPTVKTEKSFHLSENMPEGSEVQCLGPAVEDPIVITDSQDSVENLIASLVNDEHQEENSFLKRINEEQPLANSTFNQFVPLSVQQKLRDRQHLKESNENPQASTPTLKQKESSSKGVKRKREK